MPHGYVHSGTENSRALVGHSSAQVHDQFYVDKNVLVSSIQDFQVFASDKKKNNLSDIRNGSETLSKDDARDI